MTVKLRQIGPGMVQQLQQQCATCNATGTSCQKKKERQVLEVNIDRGMKNGEKIRFRGMSDEQPNGEPGDIVFLLQEKDHPVFKRKNNDLLINKDLTLKEALCGYSFTVNHLDGRKLTVASKPGEIVRPDSGLVRAREDLECCSPNQGFPRSVSYFGLLNAITLSSRASLRFLVSSVLRALCRHYAGRAVHEVRDGRRDAQERVPFREGPPLHLLPHPVSPSGGVGRRRARAPGQSSAGPHATSAVSCEQFSHASIAAQYLREALRLTCHYFYYFVLFVSASVGLFPFKNLVSRVCASIMLYFTLLLLLLYVPGGGSGAHRSGVAQGLRAERCLRGEQLRLRRRSRRRWRPRRRAVPTKLRRM